MNILGLSVKYSEGKLKVGKVGQKPAPTTLPVVQIPSITNYFGHADCLQNSSGMVFSFRNPDEPIKTITLPYDNDKKIVYGNGHISLVDDSVELEEPDDVIMNKITSLIIVVHDILGDYNDNPTIVRRKSIKALLKKIVSIDEIYVGRNPFRARNVNVAMLVEQVNTIIPLRRNNSHGGGPR